jgi:hypothetical protein
MSCGCGMKFSGGSRRKTRRGKKRSHKRRGTRRH